MTVVFAVVLGAVTVLFLWSAAADVLGAPALARSNYRNRVVPTAGGVLIVLTVLVVEAGRAVLGAVGIGDDPGLTAARALVLLAVFGFGLLGFVDDVVGQ